MKNSSAVEQNCSRISQCNYEEYGIQVEASRRDRDSILLTNPDPDAHTLSLTHHSSIVENIESVPSYNLQSLIGDIGGSLSLFLGLCGGTFLTKKSNIAAKILM